LGRSLACRLGRTVGKAKGQRAEETGGQPVTLGITRAAELVAALEKITRQHADTLTRAMTELREVGDIESAEAEVYAARTSADQRVATAEARLAEESQRRRAAVSERDAGRARQTEAAAVTRAERAQAAAAEETARIRSDHRHALNQLTASTDARISAPKSKPPSPRPDPEPGDVPTARPPGEKPHQESIRYAGSPPGGVDEKPAWRQAARPAVRRSRSRVCS
jgi:hypothetical protein